MKRFHITPEEKKYLLALARKMIIAKTEGINISDDNYFSDTLKESSGVFVTLHKNGQLRGCIGYVEGIKPLQEAVIEMSLSAAFEDPRFPPVEKDELKDIELEISVLSPLQTISNIDKILVGKHGLVIEKGFYRGLLLPQVAAEYNWNREEFLEHTCQKAGLPQNSWKDPSTKIQIFSAEIFSETD
jgi:AmmeMemoRadiSam system protein A